MNYDYAQTRWSLAELLPSTEKSVVETAIAELKSSAEAIEALRPVLSEDMSGEDFGSMIKALEEFASRASVLGGYGTLWFSEDTQSQEALAFMGRVEQTLVELHNLTLFLELWWKALPEEAARRLLAHAGDVRYHLEKQRLFSRYTLSEPEEKVIALKDVNGTNALATIYDMVTNKFVFELEAEGEKKSLTRDALMAYVRSPEAGVREAAYREQFRLFGDEAVVLAQIYMHRVRDWANEHLSLRGFTSPISVRNLSNDIPDEVVDTLLGVCREEAHVFHRYFRLKAGWLGTPRLRRFDLYAPIKMEAARKIPYADGVRLVMESFRRFSPEMHDVAMRIFDERRIDSEVRPGKRGGAFCMSVLPHQSPWVLLNYTEEPRQVATLAHELGHAVHSMMAEKHSVLTFHSALPLAETASVFAEMLLTDRMLEEEKDPAVRRTMLAEAADDAYATVLRQAFFVLFEREAHGMVAAGATADELSKAYLENLAAQFGDSVEVDDMFRHEWVSIPHIYHAPFYCYAYSFGQLLSLSLYQRYREQGAAFAPTLFRILSYGGAAAPKDILAEAGIDMADPDFWRSGFRVIEGMIEELEREG